MRTPLVPLGFSIPLELNDKLTKYQAKTSLSLRKIVLEALDEYLQRRNAVWNSKE